MVTGIDRMLQHRSMRFHKSLAASRLNKNVQQASAFGSLGAEVLTAEETTEYIYTCKSTFSWFPLHLTVMR